MADQDPPNQPAVEYIEVIPDFARSNPPEVPKRHPIPWKRVVLLAVFVVLSIMVAVLYQQNRQYTKNATQAQAEMKKIGTTVQTIPLGK